MGQSAAVHRETVVDERTSAASGTATVTTISEIDDVRLEFFDDLIVYIKTSTSLAGTVPTMDIYLQRAVHPSADPTNAAHWQDILHFPQVTAAIDEVGALPIRAAVAISAGTDTTRPRLTEGENPEVGVVGHWGDKIRIREKMGGTVTTAAVYSIHITGRIS